MAYALAEEQSGFETSQDQGPVKLLRWRREESGPEFRPGHASRRELLSSGCRRRCHGRSSWYCPTGPQPPAKPGHHFSCPENHEIARSDEICGHSPLLQSPACPRCPQRLTLSEFRKIHREKRLRRPRL